ncbi:glycyl-tRNA synthetase beta chain [Sphingomonas naasensis]|uniref:Glycine--tRNA ligase beta subunit n=1 Tax=Sphingomonas naasensis TaxID=1344951 RepID=A0A4S1WQ45_9SPHN|nr:glycine--tRNA ligase subunit beta [Sphingomonas naasensis]NIJ21018.1 glycyl-tRNA synthetase beta chain [Sphingomonas naasensis]TGX43396.1 glycine--tRNA ligase subunit beta [Sphingomonas naasensis]
MTEDFLLELRCEEIPARMQEKARADLAALFEARLKALNLPFTGVESFATPRRLALIVRGVAETTAAMTEERKGPRADAPAPAIEGFLRSTGLSREQLVTRDDGKGGQVLFAVIERPGIVAGSVLASAITNVIHAFPWAKSMRWGAASQSTESLRWVRPLQGIIALLGDKLVPVEVAGIRSGVQTVGHRFHHPGVITIGSANDYAEKLRACHVIVDGAERRAIIAVGAKLAAQKAGLGLIEDDGLLFENAGLTEWPVPLLGRFDSDFLSVPAEVIQLTARVNQKYFVCRDGAGKLANAFVCVANIDAVDGGEKIVQGNQKVLAARLSDARFFYETDLKTKLDDLRPKLEKIVFHEKLGTVADKVDRVAKLARWLVEEGIVGSSPERGGGPSQSDGGGGVPQATPPADSPLHRPSDGPPPRAGEDREKLAALAERAARLAKADLVTGMVGEFPELQGLMGGYYAAAQGEPAEVAEAIRDHYKPVGQGDAVPTAPVTVAVSLADKLDTIGAFFAIDERPTGSKDPFALRRAAIGVIQLITANTLRFSLEGSFAFAFINLLERHIANLEGFERSGVAKHPQWKSPFGDGENADDAFFRLLQDFFADRLKVQQREAGVRHDLIDAVFALGGEDDLVRLLARVHALQAFVTTEDGKNLLAGYKRAANILKKEGFDGTDTDVGGNIYEAEPAEAALKEALDAAEPRAEAAIEAEDFEAAMAALATLRAPIDAFFDDVTVNDSDPDKRISRLGQLARMRDAVHKVADFSKIEG